MRLGLFFCSVFFLAVPACSDSAPLEASSQSAVTDDKTLEVLSTNNVRLFVRQVGDAPEVVVLVHGGPGTSSDYMRTLEVLASSKRRVVTYDQRGVGRSSRPNPTVYSLASQVEDLEAVRTALGVKKIHVIAHSWGGLVAMAFAAEHPDALASLTLAGSVSPNSKDLESWRGRFTSRLQQLQAEGVIPEAIPSPVGDDCTPQVEAIMPAYFYDPRYTPSRELQASSCSQSTFDASWAGAGDFDLRSPLRALTVPLLVVQGDHDPFGHPDFGSSFPSAVFESIRLADCGHFWEECSSIALPVLTSFLDRHRGSPSAVE
jgi:proline iminopeptidase